MADETNNTATDPEQHTPRHTDFSQFDGFDGEYWLKKLDFWSHLVDNPAAADELRTLQDQNAGLTNLLVATIGKDQLPKVVAYLAGQLTSAIAIAAIEKRRGDSQQARAEAAEAKLKALLLFGAKQDELLEVTKRRIASNTVRIVGEWMRFVQSKPEYMKGAGWNSENPPFAAVHHSSLLQRMLMGEQPMSDDDYAAWKDKVNHVTTE